MERLLRRNNPSLFGEILHWMLVPLLVLWVVAMGIEYLLALSIAHAVYDRELSNAVQSLSRKVAAREGRSEMTPGAGMSGFLLEASDGSVVYQVRSPVGAVLMGDASLALPALSDAELNTVYFRDDVLNGVSMRVAMMPVRIPGVEGLSTVQVGETNERRRNMVISITGGQLSVQFLIVPMAMLLVWFGLTRGIAPLNELTTRVRRRTPQDLSPIDPRDAPEEVRAFIYSINDLMARLDQNLRAQQRFVADAAHQMRTPIAGLKTQAELALRQRDADDIKLSMRQIASGADRASRLISQLLVLARADSDAPTALEELDLGRVAQSETQEWVARALAKGIDLGYEAPSSPCRLRGNEVLLREMLGNLIDNAIRYTPSGGRVTVRLSVAGARARLEVEDNGVGIDAADREFVFERFYRVLGNGSEGTGLGLAIVKTIAQVHGAVVECAENTVESGTVMRVRFRAASEDTALLKVA